MHVHVHVHHVHVHECVCAPCTAGPRRTRCGCHQRACVQSAILAAPTRPPNHFYLLAAAHVHVVLTSNSRLAALRSTERRRKHLPCHRTAFGSFGVVSMSGGRWLMTMSYARRCNARWMCNHRGFSSALRARMACEASSAASPCSEPSSEPRGELNGEPYAANPAASPAGGWNGEPCGEPMRRPQRRT